jgi:hypothetical protein
MCGNVIGKSEPAGFFAPRNGQVFRFTVRLDGTFYSFTVIFRFADTADENTLMISEITIRET